MLTKAIGAGLAALCLPVVLLGAASGAITPSAPTAAPLCLAVPGAGDETAAPEPQLAAAQRRNAQIIVGVAARMGLPQRAAVIAVATAYQESRLRNLRRGDRDSLGLFQQRPSQGWGSAQEILDPRYAAHQFYTHLLQVPGWRHMPLSEAAQAVQRSDHPDAYAQWKDLARRVVSALSGRGITCTAHELSDLGAPCQTEDMVTIRAAGQRLIVNKKMASTFTSLITRFDRTVENVRTAGGYSCRENVNSPGDMSRHAYGAAVDLNAAQHPNGASGTFTPRQVDAIRAILNSHPNIRWGGNYTSTVDEMHFELYNPSADSEEAADTPAAQPAPAVRVRGRKRPGRVAATAGSCRRCGRRRGRTGSPVRAGLRTSAHLAVDGMAAWRGAGARVTGLDFFSRGRDGCPSRSRRVRGSPMTKLDLALRR